MYRVCYFELNKVLSYTIVIVYKNPYVYGVKLPFKIPIISTFFFKKKYYIPHHDFFQSRIYQKISPQSHPISHIYRAKSQETNTHFYMHASSSYTQSLRAYTRHNLATIVNNQRIHHVMIHRSSVSYNWLRFLFPYIIYETLSQSNKDHDQAGETGWAASKRFRERSVFPKRLVSSASLLHVFRLRSIVGAWCNNWKQNNFVRNMCIRWYETM